MAGVLPLGLGFAKLPNCHKLQAGEVFITWHSLRPGSEAQIWSWNVHSGIFSEEKKKAPRRNLRIDADAIS